MNLILSAAIVLGYPYLGGLSSAIYNEVLQTIFPMINAPLFAVIFLCMFRK